MGKNRQYVITYAYDKKKRAMLPDKQGNVRTFGTRAAAEKAVKRAAQKVRIHNPRVKRVI